MPFDTIVERVFLPIMRDFIHARTQLMSTDGEISGHVNIGLIASITEGVRAAFAVCPRRLNTCSWLGVASWV